MRKRLIAPTASSVRLRETEWLDLERVSTLEVTSEDKEHPVESACIPGNAEGWRAAGPGPQTIRIIFDQPQRVRNISLVFEENKNQRTQEFVLRWSSDNGSFFREIVRQQWNFSPPQTTREVEEYKVELSNVTLLELKIVPDIGGGAALASLLTFRMS